MNDLNADYLNNQSYIDEENEKNIVEAVRKKELKIFCILIHSKYDQFLDYILH